VGLAIGFGSSILIYLFLSYHLSFDNFHHNPDRIYRLATEEQRLDVDYEASVPPAFAKVFREDYNYAEKVAKIGFREDFLIHHDQNGSVKKFKEDVAFVEEDFFQIFNFPLLYGGEKVSLTAPNRALLTEQMALKIYGRSDVVGKSFVLENDKVIEITGVLKNLPKASFLESEVFVSFVNLEDFFAFAASESWGA